MIYNKTCNYCGKIYKASRKDSKTCSSSCRVNFSYLKKDMVFVGQTTTSTNNGKYIIDQNDIMKLCLSKGYEYWCKFYLKIDDKTNKANVYIALCDSTKRYCHNKNKGEKGSNI
jgi:hypothetical protein